MSWTKWRQRLRPHGLPFQTPNFHLYVWTTPGIARVMATVAAGEKLLGRLGS